MSTNLRTVRIEYLEKDDQPLNVRGVQVEYLERQRTPVKVRTIVGQVLVKSRTQVKVRRLLGQVLVKSRTPVKVRKVVSQVLTTYKKPASIRTVRLEFMERQPYIPDFTIDLWEKILGVLNSYNSTSFTKEHLLPQTPMVHEDHSVLNTALEIKAHPSSGFSGSVVALYRRYPIGRGIDENLPVYFDMEGVSTTHDLLDQINELYPVRLTKEEVVNLPIDPEGESIEVRITRDSLHFIEDSFVVLDRKTGIEAILTVTDLDGFSGPIYINPRTSLEDILPVTDLSGF